MAFGLTPKDCVTLNIVVRELDKIPNVDFGKIALVTGHKDAKSARSAFKRVWDKLKEGDGSVPSAKAKCTPKKVVGQRKTPAKAPGTSRRSKRLSKKGLDDAVVSEAQAEVDAEFESEDEEEEEHATRGSSPDDVVMGGNLRIDDAHVSTTGSPGVYQENQDNDELSANLLGITVEEFRNDAEETYYGNGYVLTPRGYVSSEDEA